MSTDTEVTIYYGPLHWFRQQVGTYDNESLLELIHDLDDQRRQFRLIVPGQEPEQLDDQPETPARPTRVTAESSDYATLHEHVLSNFAGLIGSIRPKQLHLHNPPARVRAQLERTISSAVDVRSYDYPQFSRATLVKVRDGFADHLVGQSSVKELLLAALYPLTTGRRTQPVVLMFYGPSGVGKTETAQFINGLLGGTLLRKQFSMFHSEKFASYLFGGSHSEPSLAHDLLDRESGVILIDEFDKANAVFHSAFYQLFDEGVLEDKNYEVRLGPSVIICTSNYGSDKAIREALGDALYSRFDAVIQFEQLSPTEVVQVIDRIFDKRFGQLDPQERLCLDREDLKSRLYSRAAQFSNVRTIAKKIDELISVQLVRSLLTDDRPHVD